jgi:hypothetical protein
VSYVVLTQINLQRQDAYNSTEPGIFRKSLEIAWALMSLVNGMSRGKVLNERSLWLKV